MGPDMAEELFSIQLFDGRNFNNWRFRLEVVLDEHGLRTFIENDVENMVLDESNAEKVTELKKNDKKAKSIIIRRIADAYLEYVKDSKSAFAALNPLDKVFAKKSISSQLFLRKKLLTMKCNETEELEAHFLKFDGLVRQLTASGAKLEKLDIICHHSNRNIKCGNIGNGLCQKPTFGRR